MLVPPSLELSLLLLALYPHLARGCVEPLSPLGMLMLFYDVYGSGFDRYRYGLCIYSGVKTTGIYIERMHGLTST